MKAQEVRLEKDPSGYSLWSTGLEMFVGKIIDEAKRHPEETVWTLWMGVGRLIFVMSSDNVDKLKAYAERMLGWNYAAFKLYKEKEGEEPKLTYGHKELYRTCTAGEKSYCIWKIGVKHPIGLFIKRANKKWDAYRWVEGDNQFCWLDTYKHYPKCRCAIINLWEQKTKETEAMTEEPKQEQKSKPAQVTAEAVFGDDLPALKAALEVTIIMTLKKCSTAADTLVELGETAEDNAKRREIYEELVSVSTVLGAASRAMLKM